MRAPKARLYGAQPLVRAPKARSYGTRPSLHDRADTFGSHLIIAQVYALYDFIYSADS